MSKYYLNYLDELESEAIFVLREVWAQFQNPVILFSGGKDSIVVTHLAKKAFYPSKIPFALFPLHDRRAGQTFLQRVVLLYCTVPGAIQKKYYLWICENELLFKVGSIILTVIVVYREKQSCCKERERRRVSLCHLVISVTIL